MNQIETILALMQNDLDSTQLSKLRVVLSTVLKAKAEAPPNEKLISIFKSHQLLLGKKETTVAQYALEINTLCSYIHKGLCEISTPDIKSYLAMYDEEHHVSKVTVQNKLRYLSVFFEYLIDEGFISKNPVKAIGRILVEKRIKKSFSPEDMKAIRKACTSTRDRALVEFLYSTGARVSECASLKVSAVDFKKDELIVFGKGHKERFVYLNKSAHQYLRSYLSERNAKPDEPLFTWLNTPDSLTSRAIEKLLKGIGSTAKVENVHPHRFRRTFATDLWKAGIPAETIRILMGHSDIQTTLRYIDINPMNVKSAFAKAFG